MSARLRSVLPTGWFPQSPPPPLPSATPVLDGLLSGLGAAWSFCFDLLGETALQSRIGTATGGFLDLIAIDFFARAIVRNPGEDDDAFRIRILGNLLVTRGTRLAISRRVAYLVGVPPIITEPSRSDDCGGYGTAADPVVGRGGYGTEGLSYGSDLMAFQYLVLVELPAQFAPGVSTSRRSPASYRDASGHIVIAPATTLRPFYAAGVLQGALIEGRSFNLITDSRNWTKLGTAAGLGVTWSLQASADALLASDVVLSVSFGAAESVSGPGMAVAAGGMPACGTVWILIAGGSGLAEAHMSLTDLAGGNSIRVQADMTLAGVWQRLEASITVQAAAGDTLVMAVGATAFLSQSGSLLTQCWQIEPGMLATSYIPTAGALGIRDADLVATGSDAAVASMPTPAQVFATVDATQPIATIAWTAIVPAIQAA